MFIATMSQYIHHISKEVRESMTVCPPPVYTLDGRIMPYSDDMMSRYADMAEMKRRLLIHVCDEYDYGYAQQGQAQYQMHMIIRCMSCDADLEVILRAALHLGLIGRYSVERKRRDGLDASLEAGYIEVKYCAADVCIDVDQEYHVHTALHIDYRERQRIWQGLFEAMGYRVRFDGAMNIRRQSL